MLKEKITKILPNKKYLILTLIICVLIAVIFTIFFVLAKKETFNSKKKPSLENETILSLMQADTDSDGVLDWEEALWGTDKNSHITFEGMTDVAYIANKKKELGVEQKDGDTRLTETEKFAREFFSAYVTLQTGEVDDITITSFANALGQRVANPSLIDQYQAKDVKISESESTESKNKYYETIKSLYEDARSLRAGDELDIVSEELLAQSATGESRELTELLVIAEAYKEFARSVIATETPGSLQDLHLLIVNSANNTGISVEGMIKVTSDPIVGLSGIAQYQKYSEDLVNTVSDLERTLLQ